MEPLNLRDETVPTLLVVVRLGSTTLEDPALHKSMTECHSRWGIWGFSVLEVPDGDYQLLARLRPIVATRRRLLEADGPELIGAGFPLLPTLDRPHWTVVLAAPSPRLFAEVRDSLSRADRESRLDWTAGMTPTMEPVTATTYDLWYDATTVGADLVVLCWISHGPRRDDPTFDPQPGDQVLVGDDEEAPLPARVIRRQGDQVSVQVELANATHAVA